MGWFYNDYKKIKQDNADAIAEISGKNKGTVLEMFQYVSAFDVSLFEAEVVKKDIIGIALEADAENTTIEEKIGCTEKEFCDSLVQDGMSHARYEKWLLRIKEFCCYLFGLYTLKILVFGISNRCGISANDLSLAFAASVLDELVNQFIYRYGLYQDERREKKVKVIGNSYYWNHCSEKYSWK